jgi:hypothetical protein
MKLFLDSADTDELERACSLGIIEGVTTNPTLLKQALDIRRKGKKRVDLEEYLRELVFIAKGIPISLEVASAEYEKMHEEALSLYQRFNPLANNVVIKIPFNPSLNGKTKTTDAVASATSLYLGLTKAGKNITIACSTPVNTEVTASDKIQNTFITKGDNLVISFPYTDGSIDKVDYNIQGSTFNLIITPRQGQPKLDAQKVAYSYTGGKVDFIITVDAPSYNALGQIYQENQAEFDGRPVINIDRHLVNNMFGTVNYVNKTASSTSELVLKLLMSMQIEIDRDMATNMYTGLTAATNYFTSYSVVYLCKNLKIKISKKYKDTMKS